MSAQRYADVQSLPVEPHTDALLEVMRAGERAAHLSRGYRPEDDAPAYSKLAESIRDLTIGLAVVALLAAFGWLLAPLVDRALSWLGVI